MGAHRGLRLVGLWLLGLLTHYHYADEQVPEAGASELERSYQRKDYGFVVEHRWQEKITNIVTLAGFLKARDELLDLCLPVYTEAIEKIFGKDYDVSRLVNHLRANGRRFLENASLILYDAAARGRVMGDDGMLDVALTKHLIEEAERCGLDRKLLEIFALSADKKESERRLNAFLAQLVVQYFKHPDGAAHRTQNCLGRWSRLLSLLNSLYAYSSLSGGQAENELGIEPSRSRPCECPESGSRCGW